MPKSAPILFMSLKFSLTSPSSSAFSEGSLASSQIGLIRLMQYLQKQQAKTGFEMAKSSPVILKGLCLLMISISGLITKVFIYLNQLNYKLVSMYALAQALYQQCFGSPTYTVCIFGIQLTGKTLLLNSIKSMQEIPKTHQMVQEETSLPYRETVGMSFIKYQKDKDQLIVRDFGGRSNLRVIWEQYYNECHGIIFMFNNNIEEGLSSLKNVVNHQQMARIPISIIATHPNTKDEIDNQLKNSSWFRDRKYIIHELPLASIPISKSVIKELLHWLYFNIKQLHEELKD